MFGDIIYKLDVLYSPFLVQITNCLFKFDRNVAIIKKKKKKIVGSHRFYQTCLIIVGGKIGGEIGEKIGRFVNRKIGGVTPHRFSCPTYRFLRKNRPTTTDFSIFVCLWKSVRNIVWWELGFSLLSLIGVVLFGQILVFIYIKFKSCSRLRRRTSLCN